MEISDEMVIAYHATRKLRDLYDAYRATSRAHVMVLRRAEAVTQESQEGTAESRTRMLGAVQRRMALAIDTDNIFAVRRDQLRRRLLELQGLPEVS